MQQYTAAPVGRSVTRHDGTAVLGTSIAHGSSSIVEHRYGMSRLLLRKQRLIGEIAPDSERIAELWVCSGFPKGTLSAGPH